MEMQQFEKDELLKMQCEQMKRVLKVVVITALFSIAFADSGNAEDVLSSPDGKIEVTFDSSDGNLSYSVNLKGEAIIADSNLGLKSDAADPIELVKATRTSADKVWQTVWGNRKTVHDHYNEIQLQLAGKSEQTIAFRAYDDGIAFRYQIPDSRKFSEAAYQHESSQVAFISETPKAWHPLSGVMVSDEVDLNTWKPSPTKQKVPNRNVRYSFKPEFASSHLSPSNYHSKHTSQCTKRW